MSNQLILGIAAAVSAPASVNDGASGAGLEESLGAAALGTAAVALGALERGPGML